MLFLASQEMPYLRNLNLINIFCSVIPKTFSPEKFGDKLS